MSQRGKRYPIIQSIFGVWFLVIVGMILLVVLFARSQCDF